MSEETKKTNRSRRNPIIGLGVLTLAATLATVGLALFGQPVAAAIIGTATLFFWLALFTVSIIAITAWWTRSTMAMGAEIALRSQESDDRRDVVLIKAVSDLTRTLLQQRQSGQPALPLPSQEADWLPPLGEVVEGEVVEGEEPRAWKIGGAGSRPHSGRSNELY